MSTLKRAILHALDANHLGDPATSVCNMLNLDPDMTTDDLTALLGTRTWEGTHEDRMVILGMEVQEQMEELRRTDPDSPFITGRQRPSA